LIRNVITVCCLLLLTLFPVFAQEEDSTDDYIGVTAYSTGEQVFALNALGIIPLFNIVPFPADGESSIGSLDSVKPGIAGSLSLGFFVMDNFMIGGELGGMIAFTENRSLSMVPITFTAAYYFIKYPFEFPVSLDAGITLNSLDDYFKVTPIIKPGAGAYWNLNGEWAIGLKMDYWFMPELYFSDELKSQSRIANFLQLSLSGVYHF